MEKEPFRTKPQEPLRQDSLHQDPAEDLDRDPQASPNLMWIFAAALLFLIGAGVYVSATRDNEGGVAKTEPTTTDSAVAGARSPTYQATGQSGAGPGTADTTGRQTPTGEQTTGQGNGQR